MPDKQLPQEQIKKFWEWCGFTLRCPPDKDAYGRGIWNYPEGTYGDLELDLNNLFKYTVPLAIDKIMAKQGCSSDVAYAILFKKWLQKLELDIPNHEVTLFWAIWEVIKAETEETKRTQSFTAQAGLGQEREQKELLGG